MSSDNNAAWYLPTTWQDIVKIIKHSHLKESADVIFVIGAHENNILEQPEERTVIVLPWFQQRQNPVELKKESASALCRTDRDTQSYQRRGAVL